MVLGWKEIRDRAVQFSKRWENETSEDAEAKSFWDEFFVVFGIDRRRFAKYEHPVKKIDNKQGFVDLFWPGMLLIEHKSKGKNLDKAYSQARDYFPGLKDRELPKYILISDFENFRLYDLEENEVHAFTLGKLHENIKLFGPLIGYQKKSFKEEDPVNMKAAELMGKIHDWLKANDYTGHQLELYLVRLVFCLFAEDTGIFNKNAFQDYIQTKTNEDGSDLGLHIYKIFNILNTPKDKRPKVLDDSLNDFEYVNGGLFAEAIPDANFNSAMRNVLLDCCALDWGKISPAIFGSLFQSVMNPEERRNLGAHYTSEKNILKLIKSLFLDNLYFELEGCGKNKKKLEEFHNKLASLKFLDPACGCGNFLVITYRELRFLEIEVIKRLNPTRQTVLDIRELILLDIDQFYGIEIEEFPVRVAEVAMWLIDHQMNMKISDEFGQYFTRLPLQKSANIIFGNALQIDWHTLIKPLIRETVSFDTKNTMKGAQEEIPQGDFNYILGNPPFIGKQMQTEWQKKDMESVFSNLSGAGVLDYVACWYLKAGQFIKDTPIKVGFVSTNSISQGEQVGILWNELFHKYNIKIHFAHRTFKWSNEAKGNAAVHVVIISFASFDISEKYIYEYEDIGGEPHEIKVKNINPYLIDASDSLVFKRRAPICSVPEISFGSMPNDGGYFLFTDEEKKEFLKVEPDAEKFVKPMLSTKEFINGKKRWCLWLVDMKPNELRELPEIAKRVQLVKDIRASSDREATKKLAAFPTLFGENRQPNTDYILIPRHSSENRKYIPMGFFDKTYIASDSCLFVANADLFTFGVLMSEMHMAWVRNVCGRIKSDFRYSNEIVYNNFPWPDSIRRSKRVS